MFFSKDLKKKPLIGIGDGTVEVMVVVVVIVVVAAGLFGIAAVVRDSRGGSGGGCGEL